MDVYMTEEEQIEMIKKLWHKYANPALTVILIIALGILGWRWWGQHTIKITYQGSAIYEQMLSSSILEDVDGVKAHGETLMRDYAKTPYGTMASLLLAKQAVAQGKLEQAEEKLLWVIKNDNDHSFKQIARIRLAKVLLAEKKYEQALDLLKEVDDDTFQPLMAQVRGDIYFAQGKRKEARMAYTLALQLFPKDSFAHRLIQMKLIELANPERHATQRIKGRTTKT